MKKILALFGSLTLLTIPVSYSSSCVKKIKLIDVTVDDLQDKINIFLENVPNSDKIAFKNIADFKEFAKKNQDIFLKEGLEIDNIEEVKDQTNNDCSFVTKKSILTETINLKITYKPKSGYQIKGNNFITVNGDFYIRPSIYLEDWQENIEMEYNKTKKIKVIVKNLLLNDKVFSIKSSNGKLVQGYHGELDFDEENYQLTAEIVIQSFLPKSSGQNYKEKVTLNLEYGNSKNKPSINILLNQNIKEINANDEKEAENNFKKKYDEYKASKKNEIKDVAFKNINEAKNEILKWDVSNKMYIGKIDFEDQTNGHEEWDGCGSASLKKLAIYFFPKKGYKFKGDSEYHKFSHKCWFKINVIININNSEDPYFILENKPLKINIELKNLKDSNDFKYKINTKLFSDNYESIKEEEQVNKNFENAKRFKLTIKLKNFPKETKENHIKARLTLYTEKAYCNVVEKDIFFIKNNEISTKDFIEKQKKQFDNKNEEVHDSIESFKEFYKLHLKEVLPKGLGFSLNDIQEVKNTKKQKENSAPKKVTFTIKLVAMQNFSIKNGDEKEFKLNIYVKGESKIVPCQEKVDLVKGEERKITVKIYNKKKGEILKIEPNQKEDCFDISAKESKEGFDLTIKALEKEIVNQKVELSYSNAKPVFLTINIKEGKTLNFEEIDRIEIEKIRENIKNEQEKEKIYQYWKFEDKVENAVNKIEGITFDKLSEQKNPSFSDNNNIDQYLTEKKFYIFVKFNYGYACPKGDEEKWKKGFPIKIKLLKNNPKITVNGDIEKKLPTNSKRVTITREDLKKANIVIDYFVDFINGKGDFNLEKYLKLDKYDCNSVRFDWIISHSQIELEFNDVINDDLEIKLQLFIRGVDLDKESKNILKIKIKK